MQEIIELFSHLTNPEWIMANGGLYIVVLIVFIETGLFFGFFLPGDSLLFIAGMVIANSLSPFDTSWVNLVFWVAIIGTSGVLGNTVGYWFGRKSGNLLLQRKDTWLFKKKYILQAKDFYDKKGGGAIVLARFLPIIRTFAPIVGGVVKMDRYKFLFYNVVGSFLWAGSIVTAGYLLGENRWAQENLEKIIIGIIIITTGPVIIKLITSRKKKMEPVRVVDVSAQKKKDI